LISFTGLQVGETIQKTSAGQIHSLALTTNGRVYAWGINNSGQLGDGSTTNRSSPTLINFSGLLSGETIQTVIAGQLHSLAVTTTGRVYAWGNGSSGQLGNGSTSNSSTPSLVNFTGLLSGETIQQVSGGAYHSISVTTSGRIYAWGYNGNGELGDETTINRSSPKLISLTGLQGGETVQMVVAGSYHSLALTTNNRIYTWGANGSGQLGSGTFLNRITPTVIAFTGLQGGETIQQISAGNFHFLVLTSTGRLFTWGYNDSGQLGNGSESNSSSPTLVNFTGLLSGETLQHVGAGAYHSFVVTSTGRLFAWGFNGSGQLGDNTIISKNRPTLITVS
jgi:alpha-tubulin suppressor-like RCC1 family protein